MTRRGKLIRNLGVVLAILGAYLLLFGFYLDPERCALASARELYFGECAVRGWGEMPDGGRIYLLSNQEGEVYACQTQRVLGLFWQTGSCSRCRWKVPGVLAGGVFQREDEGTWAVLLRLDGAVETVAWQGGSSRAWNGDVMILELEWEALEQPFRVLDGAGGLLWSGTL